LGFLEADAANGTATATASTTTTNASQVSQ
jgi:hypothetical protein